MLLDAKKYRYGADFSQEDFDKISAQIDTDSLAAVIETLSNICLSRGWDAAAAYLGEVAEAPVITATDNK